MFVMDDKCARKSLSRKIYLTLDVSVQVFREDFPHLSRLGRVTLLYYRTQVRVANGVVLTLDGSRG